MIPFWHSKVDFDRGGYNIQQGESADITPCDLMWWIGGMT